MKRIKILSFGLVSMMSLSGISMVGTTVSAATVEGQSQNTPATVEILDDGDTVDPLNPTDPTQTHLTLENVPAAYDFTTTVKNKEYTVNATLTGQNITVFNDRSSRVWSVKATVANNTITADNESKTVLPVTSFKVNDVELTGTGSTGMVAKSAATPTADNNTGKLSTAVTTAAISFTDGNNVLKAGNKLSGTISYQLYNTANAN